MNSEEKCFLESLPPVYYLLEDAIKQESIFENYLHFYDKEDIYERNVTFEINDYAQDYIAFADDNGDAVFLISKYDDNNYIYMSDLGDLTIDSSCIMAKSVKDFVKKFAEMINKESPLKYCSIVWKSLDYEKYNKKSLLRIKKALKLTDSVGELLALSRKLPQIVKEDITVPAAEKILANLNELAIMFEMKIK